MAQYVYRLKQPVLQVTYDSTTKTCAVSQDAEVTTSLEVFSLRGAESVLREASWVENITVRVRLSFAKFDKDVFEELLGTSVADKDVDGAAKVGYTLLYIDGAGYDHPDFDVKGVLQSEDGSMEMGVKIPGVMFEEFPLFSGLTGAVIPSLEGEGDNIRIHLPT